MNRKINMLRYVLGLSIIIVLGQLNAAELIDRIVAVVNDEVIVSTVLEQRLRTIKAQLKQRSDGRLPADSVIRRQVLERLIVDKLQLQMAARSGIKISDTDVNKAIRKVAQKSGVSLRRFQRVLEQEGYDFSQFREEIRNEIIINRLQQQQVKNRIKIPDYELKRFMATPEFNKNISNNKQYHVGHLLIAIAEGAATEVIQKAQAKANEMIKQLNEGADFTQLVISVSDGQNALEGGDLGWRKSAQLPSIFSSKVVNMQPNEISDPIRSASGFHIIKLLGVRGDDEKMIRQTHARHILIRTNELTSEDDALTRLQQLKTRLEDGEDFAGLAQANSDDTGSAIKGGDLGWVTPGDVVPEFQQAMDQLNVNEISAPFKTQFGWHIVQVLGHREYDASDALRKAHAKRILLKRKLDESLELWLRRLRDEAYIDNRLEKE